MNTKPIAMGVIGLGRAFTLMLPTLQLDPRIKLVSAYDPLAHARNQFQQDFGAADLSALALCEHKDIEWVYVASPHAMHAQHVMLAAQHGKHVLVEKPMAISLAECQQMINACKAANTHLIVGPSHSFDPPVLLAAKMIAEGAIGKVRMIHAMNYTDFMQRPRRPDELDSSQGGGAVMSQAPHQIEIVRMLMGRPCTQVKAMLGQWRAPTMVDGAYSALLQFEDNGFAQVSYNGYGFFDSNIWMNDVGEMGQAATHMHGTNNQPVFKKHNPTADEQNQAAEVKKARNYGGSQYDPLTATPAPIAHQHFGVFIVSGEQGDIRLTPQGITLYTTQGKTEIEAPHSVAPRSAVIDEIWSVDRHLQPATHDGNFGRDTLKICLALIASQNSGHEVTI